jgi:hypothetical protein
MFWKSPKKRKAAGYFLCLGRHWKHLAAERYVSSELTYHYKGMKSVYSLPRGKNPGVVSAEHKTTKNTS